MSALIRAMVARKRAAAANDEAFRQRHDQIVAEARGEQGPKGDKPDHEWKGTKLRFEKPDGSWGKFVDLKGADGKGGTVFIGGGGGQFNPAALDTLHTAPILSDYLVLERNGVAYRVSLSQLQTLFGGSTGVPVNVVTLNGEDITVNGEYITIGPTEDEDDMQYSKRVDSANNDTIIYRGEAAPGSADDAPVWRIVRIEFPSDGDVIEKWAGGTASFTHAWTDRETLTYL